MNLKLKCIGHSLQAMPEGDRTVVNLSARPGEKVTATLSMVVTAEEAAKMPVGMDFDAAISEAPKA